jgi:hypothetical protein
MKAMMHLPEGTETQTPFPAEDQQSTTADRQVCRYYMEGFYPVQEEHSCILTNNPSFSRSPWSRPWPFPLSHD